MATTARKRYHSDKRVSAVEYCSRTHPQPLAAHLYLLLYSPRLHKMRTATVKLSLKRPVGKMGGALRFSFGAPERSLSPPISDMAYMGAFHGTAPPPAHHMRSRMWEAANTLS